jgi:hypothetical protein
MEEPERSEMNLVFFFGSGVLILVVGKEGKTGESAQLIADYIRQANLSINDPLFCADHVHLPATELSQVMKACAEFHDVDPARIMPAGLRKNVITQMDLNTPQLQRMLQGGWRSNAGEVSYWTHLLQVADANQSAVHNDGGATISIIRTIFGRTEGDLAPAGPNVRR